MKLIIAMLPRSLFTQLTRCPSIVLKSFCFYSVIETLEDFLFGERITSATAPNQHPVTWILGIPVTMLAVIDFIASTERRDVLV
jgi:hypothetical protein